MCLKPVMQILSCLETSGPRILFGTIFSGVDDSGRSPIFGWHLYLKESEKKEENYYQQ